jgi:hypothetical protein
MADPDGFVKTHRSEEKEVQEWDDALAKAELIADIAEAVADGMSGGRRGPGRVRTPRMPRVKIPKPSTSSNKPAVRQKVATTPNTTTQQKASVKQKSTVTTQKRAPEFPGGETTETGFLNSALNWLGKGYKDMGGGRYVSADGLKQIRYGKHETTGKVHHGHFEVYDKPADKGGKVIENTVVKIVPDPKK